METQIKLKSWNISEKEDGRINIQGEYGVFLDKVEIASKAMNTGYGSAEISFSGELKEKVKELTEQIKIELEGSFK